MKKMILFIPTLFFALMLSSCFWFGKTTTYPDMVEYSAEEVLSVAKEKYHIEKWLIQLSVCGRYECAYAQMAPSGDLDYWNGSYDGVWRWFLRFPKKKTSWCGKRE